MASPQIFEDLSSVFSILLQKKSEHTFLYYPLFQDYLNLLTLIIHVASTSEDCYLFVTVSNEIAAIEATGDTSVASQMAAKGWKAVEGQTNLYVYIGTAEGASAPLAVKANENITVFEKIVISGSVDNTTLANYKDKTITVNAYAVQKDGFESKTASEIWNTTFGASKN